MVREIKSRLSMFRVVYRHEENYTDEYVKAHTAQEAVDIAREIFAPENAEIIEVAKVVNNWK